MTRDARRAGIVLGVALFLSYAYFYQAGGWNQNSRFALVRAVLERHTLQIDAYQLHTGDRALFEGHYYSDKAPGASFLALGPVWIARGISRAAGVDPEGFPGLAWTSYVAAVVTSGAFTTLAALAVFWLSVRWGFSIAAALFAATAYGLATPAWCYATLFMGHGLTAGCLMIAFAASVALDGEHAHRSRLAWVVGLAGGWAVVSEFPAAVPMLLISALAAITTFRSHRSDTGAVIGRIVAGGAIASLFLLGYNALAFGSPFHLGYASEEGFEAMKQGFFGIGYPTPHAAYEVLFGAYRGLIPLAPVVLLAPIGLVWLARRPATRLDALVALLSPPFTSC